jgi:hypothetical protein
MAKLTVAGLPSNDAGRQIIRLHHSHRGGAPRYGIVKLTNNGNGREVRAVVLGHEDDKNIYMPFDIRTALGVDKNGTLDFEVVEVGWTGKLRWWRTIPPCIFRPGLQ